jgi:FKBP-type peptidyl-prolyl cis-trans isomerase
MLIMKKQLIITVLTAGLVLPLFAADDEAAARPQNNPAAAPAEASVSNEKLLYSYGYLMGENIKEQLILETEDFKAISQGMRDSLLGNKSQTDLETYKPLIQERYEKDAEKIIANRKIGNDEFLSGLKKDKKNYKVLSNGAFIRMVKEGDRRGKKPQAASMVKVNYEGTLLDGKVFDSSYKRGAPAQFALNAVIPCWTESLQQMKTGGKAKLFCPPDTAYGDRRAGTIPPASLLIFDVELLEVLD